MPLPSPVIVVPGITASALRDEYELPPESVWTAVLKRRHDRITLHPNDLRYEAREPARIMPDHPFPIIYEDLIEELREELSPDEDQPVPVYPFMYDWRMPLAQIETHLAEFIQEVINRTNLQRHYYDNDDFTDHPTVNLIGHSMGGLIIAGYLEAHKATCVNKVVTLASPFKGSYEAILKVVTGTANLGSDSSHARERRAARVTPALYHLLPSFPNALDAPDGMSKDIFDPTAWQPSVVKSIADFIKKWGVPPDRDAETIFRDAETIFRTMLDEARQYRDRITNLQLSTINLQNQNWLAIVGVDAETRVGLEVGKDSNGKPLFQLKSSKRQNKWDNQNEDERRDTGDGTVPLRGAIPTFLDENQLVCVTPDDYGYWELKDRGLMKLAGFHGILPNMNMLHRLIVRFLTDDSDTYDNTWGRPLPGVDVDDWDPPVKGGLRHK